MKTTTLLISGLLAGLTGIAHAQAPQGIYMGSFAGQFDNGGFAIFIADGKAEIVGYNSPAEEGVYARNISVAANGQFSGSTVQGATISGTATGSGVTGTFQPWFGSPGSFSGTRKADEGPLSANAGFYEGTYSGPVSGNCYGILASDGSMFFYVIDNAPSDGDGGGMGTVSSATNQMTATILPDGIAVTGTLNPTSNQISGTYSLSIFTGTFSMTRTKALPPPLTGFAAFIASSGLTGDDALPGATPFGDGVPNLVKYAFNLNGNGPDVRTLTPGTGTAGLPDARVLAGAPQTLSFEFIRRKNGGISYTPQQSSTLQGGSWQAVSGSTTVTSINADWERVVISQPLVSSRFLRVLVNLDD